MRLQDLPRWTWYVPIAVLGIGILPMPYAFYGLLRLVVCGFAAYLARAEFSATKTWEPMGIALVVTALIFNPFVPPGFSRGFWIMLDIVGAAVFVMHLQKVDREALAAKSKKADVLL
jgi:hypothetical protein